MGIKNCYKDKYFFHFTHIDNLGSIVKYGLLSTNMKNSLQLGHTNIANMDIQNRRHNMDVSCYPYGKVHDYVPFYWTAPNPMLLSVLKKKNVDQPLIVFIAISAKKIENHNVVFTDASANTNNPPTFYNNVEDLDELDWQVIDRKGWTERDERVRHARMAEVLIKDKVPIEWIDGYVVFNDYCKDVIERIYAENDLDDVPDIHFGLDYFANKYYYFTKFFFLDRKNETLITGPRGLKQKYEACIKYINEKRSDYKGVKSKFENIKDSLEKIDENFSLIPELNGICGLETTNMMHSDNVDIHTKKVVENLNKIDYYKNLSEQDKNVVKLAAYLHDIGKGPKEKWEDGKQPVYEDHPVDSLIMLTRILVDDFEDLSEYEIKRICLLVAYHDIIGDILCNDRNVDELISLSLDENELNMLISLSIADVSAIDFMWSIKVKQGISNLRRKVLGDE